MYVCVCMYVCMHVCMYKYMYVLLYCLCLNVYYVCMYVYVCTYIPYVFKHACIGTDKTYVWMYRIELSRRKISQLDGVKMVEQLVVQRNFPEDLPLTLTLHYFLPVNFHFFCRSYYSLLANCMCMYANTWLRHGDRNLPRRGSDIVNENIYHIQALLHHRYN